MNLLPSNSNSNIDLSSHLNNIYNKVLDNCYKSFSILIYELKQYYNSFDLKLFVDLHTLKKRLCYSLNQRLFLLKCRYYNILPRHLIQANKYFCYISLKNKNNKNNLSKTQFKVLKRVLNLEIKDIHIVINS